VPYGSNALYRNGALQKPVARFRHAAQDRGNSEGCSPVPYTSYHGDVAILLTALPWQQTRECNSNVEVKQKIALLGWRGGWTIACRPVRNEKMTWPMYIQRQFGVITCSHPTLTSHYFLQPQLLLLMQPEIRLVYEYTCVGA
jgi:hypothetical protein